MIALQFYVVAAFWLGLTAIAGGAVADRNGLSLLAGRANAGTMSVPVIHNVHRNRNFALEYYKTLAKYHIPIPDGLQKVFNKAIKIGEPAGEDGSVPAASYLDDLEWLAPVSIGEPPQLLYLDYDTGSADTWTFSSDTNPMQVKGQALWNVNKSTTAQLIPNATWDILYGDFSSCRGIVYKDTLTIGNLSLPGMTIESAQTVSTAFSRQNVMSGILGLGFPKIMQTTPLLPTLTDLLKKYLNQALFTSDLRHNSSEGSYNFGFIDHSLHDNKSEIKYVDVDDSEGYWGVQFTGFAVETSNLQWEYADPPVVIVDTGSSLLYAPDEAVTEYYKLVRGAQFSYEQYGWLIPCNATPPSFEWQIGDSNGKRIGGTIPGEFMLYDEIEDGAGMCYSGLQTLGPYSSLKGILGDIWLKTGFQVFDIGQKRFGFAPKSLNVAK